MISTRSSIKRKGLKSKTRRNRSNTIAYNPQHIVTMFLHPESIKCFVAK